MKFINNLLTILFVASFSLSCKHEVKEHKFADNNSIDSLLYSTETSDWSGLSGMYASGHTIISFCEYDRLVATPYLSDSSLSLFIKNGMIPEYDLKIVPGYQTPDKFIPAKKINYSKSKTKETPVIYYEITTAPYRNPYHKLEKTIGKLYCFYAYHGNSYISDTTEKYGSFIVRTPAFIKPPAYALDAPNKLRITSLDKKSQDLCSEYEKCSQIPYRLIRDEEVNKPKNAKP